MWLKFLLIGLIPVVVGVVAALLVAKPLQTIDQVNAVNRREDRMKDCKIKVNEKVDEAIGALTAYAVTRDKQKLAAYEKAAAEIQPSVVEFEKTAGEGTDYGGDQELNSRTTALLDAMKAYNAAVSDAKSPPEKLAETSKAVVRADRDLSTTMNTDFVRAIRECITDITSMFSMGLTFLLTFGTGAWIFLFCWFAGSCFRRYKVVRRNIEALAEGRALEPRTKFGCWDEIEKLDKAVHEAAGKMGRA